MALSTVGQYRTIAEEIITQYIANNVARVSGENLTLDNYRYSNGFIAGLKAALGALGEAAEKLYGEVPAPNEPLESLYE